MQLDNITGHAYTRRMGDMDKNQLYYGDNLEILNRYIKDESVDTPA